MLAGLGVLKFSMDSLDDDKTREIRGVRSDFSSSFEKIREVIEYKKKHPSLNTNIVITMISLSNSEDQKEMELRFLDLWKLEEVFSYIKTQDNQWLHKTNKVLREIDSCTKEYCEYPWTSMSIMADGSVVPCTQDYDCEMVMGNVREQSLKKIWNGEKYRRFRERHITGEFPKNFKCTQRCDQIMVSDRLNGVPPTHRII